MFLIDHESAFSFIYAVGAQGAPWEIENAHFLENHVFYRGLKGGRVDADRFVGALAAISDDVISRMTDHVPTEWKNEHLTKILEHLRLVRDHATEFGDQVKRRLA